MSNENVLITRKRLLVILIIMIVAIILLVCRAGYWSLIKGEWLQAQAEDQWTKDVSVNAKRGSIMDRNQVVLAKSSVADTVVLLPEKIKKAKNADQVATELARILNMEKAVIYNKAIDTSKKEVWIKRQITTEQANEIESLKLEGVSFTDDVKRFYRNKDFAAQVIGYTTMDGVGQTGIEKRYNRILEGRHGRKVAETAKDGSGVPNGQQMLIESQDGMNVVLTIDEIIQSDLETVCSNLFMAQAPESVQGVIMDVTNGEVLGMANIPQFDLNNPPREDEKTLTNLSANVITATPYEPGNIFGVFTSAAAINENVAASEYTCEGSMLVDSEKINCKAIHGDISLSQGIQTNCSICAASQAAALGKDSFYYYLKTFGFGEKTGIDFSTDTQGDVMEKKYIRNADVALMGTGVNLKVSQMQLINAAASLVNGGNIYVPRLVMGLADQEGIMKETYQSELKGQTISPETSAKMKEIMESYVKTGEGNGAKIAGYTVGAFGGTAMLYKENLPVQDKEIASFVAYAPASSPKYMVMITANGIAANSANNTVCMPYVKEVMEDTLKYSNIPPDDEGARNEQTVKIPNVVGLELQAAKDALSVLGFEIKADGTGLVQSQIPVAEEEAYAGTLVTLSMDTKTVAPTQNSEMVSVPNFTGMSVLAARDAANAAGLKFVALGSGTAMNQKPAADLKVQKGSTVTVDFKLQIGTTE
ncbi:MAG: penicillin-binding transpeptidase domain-containing protein [Christensenellaceae bacterium]